MNCESPPVIPAERIEVEVLEPRLLRWMRRLLLVDVQLTGELSPQITTSVPGEAPEVDVVVIRDLSALDAVRPLMTSHAAVYVVHGGDPPLAAHNLVAYVTWPEMTLAVPSTYDPVAHARELLRARRVHEAYEVLINVPASLVAAPESKAALAGEMQWCLLAAAASSWGHPLNLFYRAQEQFFIATTYAPYYAPSYLCHARHWQLIGRDDMARRLLRTCNAVAPTPEGETMLAGIPDRPPPDGVAHVPDIAPLPRELRLLIVCHEGSDYGLDTLYDGLCDVLGDDAVVEIPWKPTLHGQHPERAEGYPCVYSRGGTPVPLPDAEAWLREGRFDAVLYADTLMTLDREGVRQLMRAAGDLPLFIVDTWDEGGDYRKDILSFLGRDACAAYFKREMLAGVDYGPHTYPLPFAYSDANLVVHPFDARDRDVFWAGKPAGGLRPVYLDWLRETHGVDPGVRYTQIDYREALARSRIGLNLFGYGFDTVRHWEVPAHGAMLLSERPPICIPHPFVDGTHAVYFGDLPELRDKLAYYLSHPAEAAAIAGAGHAHYRRHHTGVARARQFVQTLEGVLVGR